MWSARTQARQRRVGLNASPSLPDLPVLPRRHTEPGARLLALGVGLLRL